MPTEQFAALIRIFSMHPQPAIYHVRGRQVMIASDLAPLFGVTPKRLNEQIRRNESRFPPDFGFRLTRDETANLRPHFEASSLAHGGHRHPPFVITDYGVVMLANVLNSERAIAMSVRVVREFIRLRSVMRSEGPVREKLRELEHAIKMRLDKHEGQIEEIFAALEGLIDSGGNPPNKRIGFVP